MRASLALGFCATLASLTGCYSAQIDRELDGVYACENDDDCADVFACINKVCVDTRGPQLSIIGPEEFVKLQTPVTDQKITVIVGGSDLKLTEPGGANVEGEGHVEVQLDEQTIELLTVGSLAGSPSAMPVAVPEQPGIHRITAFARQNDGTRYENPGASQTTVFWVNDGMPHVGIRRPVPNDVYVPDPETGQVSVPMDLVTINFDILNPSTVPGEDLDKEGQGHLHVIFNRGVPDCIPSTDCNDVYVAAVFPIGDETVQRISPSPNPLPLPPSPPGMYQVAVVLEYSSHTPYPSDLADEVVFDAIDVQIVEP